MVYFKRNVLAASLAMLLAACSDSDSDNDPSVSQNPDDGNPTTLSKCSLPAELNGSTDVTETQYLDAVAACIQDAAPQSLASNTRYTRINSHGKVRAFDLNPDGSFDYYRVGHASMDAGTWQTVENGNRLDWDGSSDMDTFQVIEQDQEYASVVIHSSYQDNGAAISEVYSVMFAKNLPIIRCTTGDNPNNATQTLAPEDAVDYDAFLSIVNGCTTRIDERTAVFHPDDVEGKKLYGYAGDVLETFEFTTEASAQEGWQRFTITEGNTLAVEGDWQISNDSLVLSFVSDGYQTTNHLKLTASDGDQHAVKVFTQNAAFQNQGIAEGNGELYSFILYSSPN